jgi:hypothetical protein
MIGDDMEAVFEVETVGGVALDAAIEVDLFAVEFPGLAREPFEEAIAEALVAVIGQRDQVVDVEVFAPFEAMEDPVAGCGEDLIVSFESDEVVAVFGLEPDTAEAFSGGEVGSQLEQDGGTAFPVGFGFCASDACGDAWGHGAGGASR